jgi:hypothetical protein
MVSRKKDVTDSQADAVVIIDTMHDSEDADADAKIVQPPW